MPKILKPQEGKQTDFLASPADICIYGGSAGSGKSFSLLLNPLRYKNVKGFNCTIFRKNFNQIFAQGGLWDEALNMYTGIKGAEMHKGEAAWEFHNAKGERTAKVSFAHIERYAVQKPFYVRCETIREGHVQPGCRQLGGRIHRMVDRPRHGIPDTRTEWSP